MSGKGSVATESHRHESLSNAENNDNAFDKMNRMGKEINIHTYIKTHTLYGIHTHLHTHIYTHTHIHTHIYTHTHLHTLTHTHTHTHTHTPFHTQTHTHPSIHRHTHTLPPHTLTHACTFDYHICFHFHLHYLNFDFNFITKTRLKQH